MGILLIDYLVISRILQSVRSFIDDTVDRIRKSGNCADEEGIDAKMKEFGDTYERLLSELKSFAQDSERYLALISNMKYSFKPQELKSEPQCVFPPNEIQKFIIQINGVDARVFDAFKKIGDLKAEVIKSARSCLRPSEKALVAANLQKVDDELDLSIRSKELFYHPMDEIESALPVDLWPEDRRFIELLFKCTTDLTSRLEEGLIYMRESGRGVVS